MQWEATLNSKTVKLEVRPDKNGGYRLTLDGETLHASSEETEPSFYSLLIDGQSFEVAVDISDNGRGTEVAVHLFDGTYHLTMMDPMQKALAGSGGGTGDGASRVTSPMPGKVLRIMVKEGQAVKAGDGVAVVEAMKMENELKAPKDGTVEKIHAEEGDTVESGSPLVTIQ